MADIVSQPWFWPAVIVSVGLPLLLIGLTEFHNSLARRGSRAAPIILMVRNYLVPVAGILVLITQPGAWQGQGTWPKVIATIFGLLVIVVVINAINHLVFHRGEKGSWRDRFPTIFSDLIRFVFIILGIAAVFWWVWDADVAGVFAALGVTSIVVGFALQKSVGSIVSGLFLIFEAPFELGDWIETGGIARPDRRGELARHPPRHRQRHRRHADGRARRGLVHEPLAQPRPVRGDHQVAFGTDDPPGRVRELLVRVARDIPLVSPDREPTRQVAAGLEVRGRDSAAQPRRPRRRARHLPHAALVRRAPGRAAPRRRHHRRLAHARRGCRTRCGRSPPTLSLKPGETDALAAHARLERYCAGESMLRPGTVPDRDAGSS